MGNETVCQVGCGPLISRRLFPAVNFPDGHIFPKEYLEGPFISQKGPFISQRGHLFPKT